MDSYDDIDMMIEDNTPLIWAVIGNSIECGQLLLDHSASIDIEGEAGTALDCARNRGIEQFIINYQELPEIKEANPDSVE